MFSNSSNIDFHYFQDHPSGFTYANELIDIVRTFLLFYLWNDRCASTFKDIFFST